MQAAEVPIFSGAKVTLKQKCMPNFIEIVRARNAAGQLKEK